MSGLAFASTNSCLDVTIESYTVSAANTVNRLSATRIEAVPINSVAAVRFQASLISLDANSNSAAAIGYVTDAAVAP